MKQKIILLIAILSLLSLAVFVSAVQYYDLRLTEGWELVSYSAMIEGSNIDLNSIKAVWFYDENTKEYVEIYPKNKLKQLIRSGNGPSKEELYSSPVWIYVENSHSINLNSEILNQENLKLSEGWNFITTNSKMMQKNLNDFKGNCNIQEAYFWNVLEPDWAMMPLDKKFYEDELLGRGFIVKVSDNCKFQLDESSGGVQPPTIPDNTDNVDFENWNKGVYEAGIQDLDYLNTEVYNECFWLLETGEDCIYNVAKYIDSRDREYYAIVENQQSDINHEEFEDSMQDRFPSIKKANQLDSMDFNHFQLKEYEGQNVLLWSSDSKVIAILVPKNDIGSGPMKDLSKIYMKRYPSQLD